LPPLVGPSRRMGIAEPDRERRQLRRYGKLLGVIIYSLWVVRVRGPRGILKPYISTVVSVDL